MDMASNSGSSEGAGGGFDTSSGGGSFDDFGSTLGDFGRIDRPLFPNTAPAVPSLAASTDAHRNAFDDDHIGFSRASAAKTVGSAALPVSGSVPTRVTSPRTGPAFATRCPPVDCTFDANSLCDYVVLVSDSDLVEGRIGDKVHDWVLTKERVGNTLTGIPTDLSTRGGYLLASGVEDPQIQFVLSSRTPLTLPAASRLDFFVYLAGVAGRLRVCFDSLETCPFEVTSKQIGLAARQWNNFFVTVPEGSHSIYFVADGLKKNYVIGLDHIQLLSKYGMSAQPC